MSNDNITPHDITAAATRFRKWIYLGRCDEIRGSTYPGGIGQYDQDIHDLAEAYCGERDRLIAMLDAAEARVRQLDGDLADLRMLRDAHSKMIEATWRSHEQQFDSQRQEIAKLKDENSKLRHALPWREQ